MGVKQVYMDIYKLTNDLIHSSEFKTEEEFQKIVNNIMNPFSAIISTKSEILVFEGIDKLSLYEYLKNRRFRLYSGNGTKCSFFLKKNHVFLACP